MSTSTDSRAVCSSLEITTHAADRWSLRVRGDERIPTRAAKADLLRCAQVAEFRSTPPPWLSVHGEHVSDFSCYLTFGDDIAIVVVPESSRAECDWAALTVVTRTDYRSHHEYQRRVDRRLRRAAVRARPQSRLQKFGRRPVPPLILADQYD